MTSRPASPLLGTLTGLRKHLEGEFIRGRIWYESDLHHATMRYLVEGIVNDDDRWIIGSQHWLGSFRPDIACYHRGSESYESFLRDPEQFVRGVIELKFASGLGRDIEKLETIQEAHPDVLVWMVYGDHFDPSIHKHWAKEQSRREASIMEWQRADASGMKRGSTILKCGSLKTRGKHAETLASLNNRGMFWQSDRFPRSSD